MQTIMKLKREQKFEKPIICFDTYPYYKTMGLEEYKGDRVYETQDTLDQMIADSLFLEGEELERAKQEIEQYEKDLENRQRFISAKNTVKTLSKYGFYSAFKSHFEADDIAFAIAEKARQYGLTAILLSTDSDWVTFRSKEVEYSNPKGDHRYSLVKERLNESKSLGIPLYEIGVLHEIYNTSHNNVPIYAHTDTVDFSEFATKIYNQDTTLPDFEDINKVYVTMNIRQHLPELDKLLDFSLSRTDLATMVEWGDFLKSKKINLSYSTYSEFTKGINQDYLHRGG